jgi:pyrimidine operon attenuation protein / uracil phosphoribosyltransferase
LIDGFLTLDSSQSVTESSTPPRQLLDASGVDRCLDEIARAIQARWPHESRLALVGVYRRGVPFSEALALKLRALGCVFDLGRIDITQYRDDLKTMTVLPKLEGSDIPFDLEDAVVILCDEVIYTARTTRAALDELLDFGRPRCVQIAALVDRSGRELPLTAEYAGIRVDLPAHERVSVRFMDGDGRDEVFIKAWERKTDTP